MRQTTHAVTPGTSGTFNGLVVSPTANVPYGLASVVIGGITFSYAAGNILAKRSAAANTNYWGGALISSIIRYHCVTTGVASTASPATSQDRSQHPRQAQHPQQNQIGFFGYGFVPARHASRQRAARRNQHGQHSSRQGGCRRTARNPDATAHLRNCRTRRYTMVISSDTNDSSNLSPNSYTEPSSPSKHP